MTDGYAQLKVIAADGKHRCRTAGAGPQSAPGSNGEGEICK